MTDDEIKAESESLSENLVAHRNLWDKLELALSTLLFHVLHVEPGTSNLAYAVYFTPDGFRARQEIVHRAMTLWSEENTHLGIDLLAYWNRINSRLRQARNVRNTVAHGSVQLLAIRGTRYVRLVPPVFDPELARLANRGTIPGVTAADLTRAVHCLGLLRDCASVIGDAVRYYRANALELLRERCRELEEHLTQLDSLFKDDRT